WSSDVCSSDLYGVNVSVVAGRQLVGFVVPARHIAPLLRRALAPLDESRSPTQLRGMIAQQALAFQQTVLDPWPQDSQSQAARWQRSEEHTSELQSRENL